MAQVWYIGPFAHYLGDYGGDVSLVIVSLTKSTALLIWHRIDGQLRRLLLGSARVPPIALARVEEDGSMIVQDPV